MWGEWVLLLLLRCWFTRQVRSCGCISSLPSRDRHATLSVLLRAALLAVVVDASVHLSLGEANERTRAAERRLVAEREAAIRQAVFVAADAGKCSTGIDKYLSDEETAALAAQGFLVCLLRWIFGTDQSKTVIVWCDIAARHASMEHEVAPFALDGVWEKAWQCTPPSTLIALDSASAVD